MSEETESQVGRVRIDPETARVTLLFDAPTASVSINEHVTRALGLKLLEAAAMLSALRLMQEQFQEQQAKQ